MDNSKRGLNLVGTTVADIKNDLLGIVNVLQGQLLPVSAQWAKIMQSAKIGGIAPGSAAGSNKVADSGVPAAGGAGGTGGGNVIAGGGSTGGRGGGTAAAIANGVIGFGNFVSQVMPDVRTSIQQDLLTTQSAFYGQGGFGGSLRQQSANVRALQVAMANRGIATSSMDTTKALAAAQGLGLSGASNFNQVMMGAATASNFAPGLGVQGATQVMGTMNAPGTVNMLQTVGIRVRGPNGSLMTLPEIVEQLWQLITQHGKVSLSEREVQFSLMPGNGLHGMLTSLYGNDEATITLVSNMLLAKAKSGGKLNLSTADRADLEKTGLSTATTNKIARQTAGQTKLLTETASATAAGYGMSADLGNALNNFAAAAGPLTQALGAFNGGYTGTMGLGNGTMGTVFKTGAAALAGGRLGGLPGAAIAVLGSLLFGREKGGPTDANTPYIVGEKGPELFVPKNDGVVIPNHLIGNRHREGGGPVKGMKTGDDLANYLVSQGFSRAGAEGVVGNLVWESGLNTTAKGDNGTSYGLAQWHGGRWKNLNKFAKSQGMDPSTADAQMAFLMKELEQKQYKGLVADLKNPNISKVDAAAKFMRIFERPSNQSNSMAVKRANAYKGELGISTSAGLTDSNAGAGNSTLTSGASSIDYSSRIQSLLATSASAVGLGGAGGFGNAGITYNNGPLTININGTSDPKKVAVEVKKILETNYRVQQTGTN